MSKEAKNGGEEITRTSLRMTTARRDTLKGLTRRWGFPNQDETLGFMVDYMAENAAGAIDEKAEAAAHEYLERRQRERQGNLNYAAGKLKNMTKEEIDALLAKLGD